MPDSVLETMTNTTPKSCVQVNCSCDTMWSLAQQFSYLRLSTPSGDFKSKIVNNYAVRARRIAGTYARFYLETEDAGNAKHKGRYYWMALGAFASKTVACTLELGLVHYSAKVVSTMKEGLGKGNYWLFSDISGWHWYYSNHPSTFKTCIDSRNSETYVTQVKAQVKKLPWNATALPKIKNLQVSKEIKLAFEKVIEFEGAPEKRQPAIQMAHLLAVADHEQGVILQPLIYDDPFFAAGVKAQRAANSELGSVEQYVPIWRDVRKIVQSVAPDLELVFSSACETKDANLKSVAPKETKLEEFKSRMNWISDAAKQFHKLMQDKTAYMEGEIRTMASWYDMADKK